MSYAAIHVPEHPRDPVGWHLAVSLAFLALCLIRLTIPSQPYFDEVHYLPAAREMLDMGRLRNPEHPMLGKELIAFGISLFGDNPFGWRIMSVLFGVLALVSVMRAMWFASMSRFASVASGILVASGFSLFVISRIAMLDIFMAGFLLFALWMCAGALRENETARWRLAIAGVALGCAMASKWNAIALAMVPGLAFFAVRLWTGRWRFLTSRRGWPVGGMTLIEGALWLGAVPILVYFATFIPGFFFETNAIRPGGLIEHQRYMLELQGKVIAPHTYQSVWYEWVGNWRAIWFLYEEIDGAQRGILLVGNPLTMLFGLPAVIWCGWMGLTRGRRDAAGVFILYAVSLGFWIIAAKPIQFYYHYLLPGIFLLAALALALDAMWQRGRMLFPLFVLGLSCTLFAWFWPILSAATLEGPAAFETWTWLDSWR